MTTIHKDNCQNYAEVKNSLTQHTKLGYIFAVVVVLSESAELNKVQRPNLWLYEYSTGFLVARATLSSTLNSVFRRSHRSRTVLTVRLGCALNEVRDVKEYVTGLEVSPTGRCSLLSKCGRQLPSSRR